MQNINEQAEIAIIRTLVMEPDKIGSVRLEPEDFFTGACRRCYVALKKLLELNAPVDLIALSELSGETVSSLSKWVSGYESSLFLERHVEIVAKHSVMRQIQSEAQQLEDPKDFIQKMKQLETKLESRKMPKFEESMKNYYAEWAEKNERRERTGAIGLITGFDRFDEYVGLEPTTLVVLAARSSVGKSAFALNVAVNAAHFNQRVLFFSIEMREGSLIDRIAATVTGNPVRSFKRAEANAGLALLKSQSKPIDENLSLIFMPNATSDDICLMSRVSNNDRKVDLIVVDYLQYMKDPVNRGTNNDRIAGITMKLKALAGELNCCVLLLSQVNRKAAGRENGMPELEDLRDSGSIEQDADVVVFINRAERSDCVAEMAIKKNREGPADLGIRYKFNPQTTKFIEYANKNPYTGDQRKTFAKAGAEYSDREIDF